jgi:hypothetical protein
MLTLAVFFGGTLSGMGQCAKPGVIDLKRTLNPAGTATPISLVDVNGDGAPDLASYQSPDKVTIAFGIGNGDFGPPTTYVVGSLRSAPFWGDVSGDGKPEMLLTTGSQLDVWLNNGSGGFTLINTVMHSGQVSGVADFNGDGKGDLLSTIQGGQTQTSTFTIRMGTGTGGFGAATTYFGFGPVDRTLRAYAGDINGDGKPDVAAALDFANDAVRIFLNDGTGGLLLPPATGVTATEVRAVVDVNNDGKAEVIGSRPLSDRLIVAKSTGTNAYASQEYPLGGNPTDVQMGDFDGDGKKDLFASYGILGGGFDPGDGVLIGDGLGGFTASNVKKPDLGLAGDLNQDGKTDFLSYGTVLLTNEIALVVRQPTCNGPGDPHKIDYDGDGKSEFAIFRPSNGGWFGRASASSGTFFSQLGVNGDIPAPGDFVGDGLTDFAVFRPSSGAWYVQSATHHTIYNVVFGQMGDKPVPGDYDGDGQSDIAVYRPSNGAWYMIQSATNTFVGVGFGIDTDVPVPADFDGDRKTDIAVFRPSNGAWYLIKSATNSFAGQFWGSNGDHAVAADYDADGKADIAVFRPSNGAWFILRSYNSSMLVVSWGQAGDVPIPGFVVPDQFFPPVAAAPVIWRPSANLFFYYSAAPQAVALGVAGDVPVSSPYIVE